MTKIDIISGFLGAGKTTFIKKLLQEAIAGEQVVLIENEFGEIGIDGGFLQDAGIEIREMNSGCICCSLVGDFGKSLEEVLTKYQPERVIIEPSGVGKLSDVMNAVRDVAKNLEVKLNSAVTVVDANKCKMYMKNFGEFFNNQVENAGTIILSRTDIADPNKVQMDVEMLREKNASATIVTTPIDQLSGAQLLEFIEKPDTMMEELLAQVKEEHEHHHHHHEDGEECGCGHHHDHDEEHEHHHHHHEDGEECSCGHHHDHDHDHHHHHADDVFTSWGLENVGAMSHEALEDILKKLAYGTQFGDVLRAKGMIPEENKNEWMYFDLVPEQYEIRSGAPTFTGKVCVIGADLKEDELSKAFGK
jgi:G3E family GTPase